MIKHEDFACVPVIFRQLGSVSSSCLICWQIHQGNERSRRSTDQALSWWQLWSHLERWNLEEPWCLGLDVVDSNKNEGKIYRRYSWCIYIYIYIILYCIIFYSIILYYIIFYYIILYIINQIIKYIYIYMYTYVDKWWYMLIFLCCLIFQFVLMEYPLVLSYLHFLPFLAYLWRYNV